MPSTEQVVRLQARMLSTAGRRMAKTSRRFFMSPMVNNDMEAGLSVSHSASAAAIFIGCIWIMCCAWE